MSDINNNNFIVPYPPEDVYGIGIIGPSAPAREDVKKTVNEKNKENNVEEISNQNSQNNSQKTDNVNGVNSKINTDVKSDEFINKNTEKEIVVPSISNTSDNFRLEDHLGKNVDTTV